MRIVAIELTETAQRAAYLWTETPFAPPRLLIDAPLSSLLELRRRLETEYFGEPMQRDAYQIVTLAETLDTVRAAFADLDVVGLRREALELINVFALAESQVRPNLMQLCDYIETTLIDQLPHADFEALRSTLHLTIAGRSARVLAELVTRISGSAFRLPVIPTAPAAHQLLYKSIPVDILDLRLPAASTRMLTEPLLLVLAVASDPGIGREELTLLGQTSKSMVVIANTHADPQHFAAMAAYIQAEIAPFGAVPIITDLNQIKPTLEAALTIEIRAWLLGWLSKIESASDELRSEVQHIRQIIENFTV